MQKFFKNIFNQEEGEKKNKKKIENMVVFVIILIITIIIINNIWSNDENQETINNVNKELATSEVYIEEDSEESLEKKLANILNTIEGVGEVNVFVNYSESSTVEVLYNENTKESTTEETDTSGGVRTIQETDTQKEVIYSEEDGNKNPVTKKTINPVIEGAIITAEGAGDTTIKSNIISAVSAVTGLATHKIQVFEIKK